VDEVLEHLLLADAAVLGQREPECVDRLVEALALRQGRPQLEIQLGQGEP
jgi:hypothetical protein